MKRADLQKKLQDELIRQVALEAQLDGTRKLYEAALLVGTADGATQFRDNMHTLLDAKLDNIAGVMVITRQLAETPD